jgi:hypothetical protein
MSNFYIYAFIREDLSPEQKIVQLGHAAFEAGRNTPVDVPIPNLILLSARDEDDLKSISRKLDGRGINHHMFYEPDWDIGNTAICTTILKDNIQRGFFRKWDLYRQR